MALAPGTRFGAFEILGSLGKGGMGEVWRARDVRLQREVALKVLPESFRTDPDRLTRFEQEARTASNLNHPNILTIFEIGDVDGVRFIASELVAGETLRTRVAPGARPLPIVEVLDLVMQMADGIAAAHDAGIVHRDLKPDNVMVRPDGLVKVLDFGLARAAATGRRPADTVAQTVAETATGTIAGTVAYMSPEQARGRPVDARSDVFSLGAVLYQLLCGVSPFAADTTTDMLVAILDREPPELGARRPDVPPELLAVVTRCLRKDPARRYGSAREVLAALEAVRAAIAARVPSAADTDGSPSVAVLPFANMSADPENEFFCDGVAEEITNALVRVRRLRVAGRTSAFSFKGKTGDLREIGRALDVATVLEGSVRKAGGRIRVTAQLVKVADGYQLWSERFDRQLEDIFEIQDEIALAVVEALKVTLLGGEKEAVLKRATADAEAYQLCLKARHVWHRWTDEAFHTAEQLFQGALEKDPDYALAHFGLGDCLAARGYLGREPIDMPRMRRLLEDAIRLDPGLAAAHAVLGGVVDGLYGWQWADGERRCRTALDLAPRDAHVHLCYGLMLVVMGRIEEGIRLLERSVELDPLGVFWHAVLVEGLVGARDWDRALRRARAGLELAPDLWMLHYWGGLAWLGAGHYDEAVAAFERAGDVPPAVGSLGHVLARCGRPDEARRLLERLRRRGDTGYVSRVALASVHAGLGETDEAFRQLDEAWGTQDPALALGLSLYTTLDPLRPDPRFGDLRRRVNLPAT